MQAGYLLPNMTADFGLSTSNSYIRIDQPTHKDHASSNASKFDYPFAFGACLLTRDDTMILPEWLAYHYTVLPLRHLIVAVDPLSITTPKPLFDAFLNYTDMEIEMWTGNFYFLEMTRLREFNPLEHHQSARDEYLNFHRARQRGFYTRCLQSFKKHHPEVQWVLMLDSDEYLTYDPPLPIELALQEKENAPTDERIENATRFRETLPKKIGRQNETIAHWIESHGQVLGMNESLCTVYPRLFFSAIQERLPEEEDSLHASLPSWSPIESLNTMRFPSHWPHRRDTPVKSLVNIQNYDDGEVLNPHRPFKNRCTGPAFCTVRTKTPFRIHHYSGSLETFLFRPSRRESMWRKKNDFRVEGSDNSLSEWYRWFLNLVGEDAAKILTLDMIEQARQEWLDIKLRTEKRNETVAPVFEWDRPPFKNSPI